MQIKDKERFDQEKASLEKNGFFINDLGQNSKDLIKPVLGHDSVKPKKPLNAYMFFSINKQKEVRQKNPDVPSTEVAKIMGKQWAKFSEKQKAPYHCQAQKDLVRFDKETKELMEFGFFTNQDGIKSTDVVKNSSGQPKSQLKSPKAPKRK